MIVYSTYKELLLFIVKYIYTRRLLHNLMSQNKEEIQPTTSDGYMLKGIFYILAGLVGKFLSR